MSREIELVYWCNTCKLSSAVKNQMDTCAFCQGTLEEMGWVENE